MSPGTSSSASSCCSCPARRTVAVGETISISDWTGLSAWYSWMKPIVPLTTSTAAMTIASDQLSILVASLVPLVVGQIARSVQRP
jgi:hypothetical protein